MSRKALFYLLFFTLIVVGFYLALSYFVPDFVKPRTATIGRVQPFRFADQDGQPVTEKDLAGKVVAVQYFFTTCKGICPRMNGYMRSVYDDLKGEPDFRIYSHTSDPATDSSARLRRYADSMAVDTRVWRFITGPKDSLYYIARNAYRIDDPKNTPARPEDDFLHTQFIALIDREGKVQGIYDGLKTGEIDALRRDARKLLHP